MASRRPPADDFDDEDDLPEDDDTVDYQWWQVPAQLPQGDVVIHLYEPAHTSLMDLMRRVRSRNPKGPFIVDDGERLKLHFSLRYTQSEMLLDEPNRLMLAYTRKMMAFLLFCPRPRDIAIIGLGGGSLSKFCYHKLPGARVTTIEIDPQIIEMASMFELPAPDARMRIVNADAGQWLADTRHSFDAILLDGCDEDGVAPSLADESFFAATSAHLKPDGVLVANLVGRRAETDQMLRNIGKVFEDRVLIQTVDGDRNRIVTAFCADAWPPDRAAAEARIPELTAQLGLEFRQFASDLFEQNPNGARGRRKR